MEEIMIAESKDYEFDSRYIGFLLTVFIRKFWTENIQKRRKTWHFFIESFERNWKLSVEKLTEQIKPAVMKLETVWKWSCNDLSNNSCSFPTISIATLRNSWCCFTGLDLHVFEAVNSDLDRRNQASGYRDKRVSKMRFVKELGTCWHFCSGRIRIKEKLILLKVFVQILLKKFQTSDWDLDREGQPCSHGQIWVWL